MKRAALVAVILCIAFSRPLAARPPKPGALVIVGGGGTIPAITAETLRLAGGPKCKLVVVPLASRERDAGLGLKEFWKSRGAEDVTILNSTDAKKARREVQGADLIWLGGGSQSLLVKRLRQLDLLSALRAAHKGGAVIGGTSAGAAAQSEVMITGKARLDEVSAKATETSEGIGLWKQAIVDQHFHRRRRFNRLLSVVLDHPKLIGVGIDERTAVVVEGDELRVLGESSVLVVDARRASVTGVKDGSPQAATGIDLHLLASGKRWSVRRTRK